MPMYRYRCGSCEARFYGIKDFKDPVPPCEKCRSTAVEIVISAPAVIYKSEGFHKRAGGSMRQWLDKREELGREPGLVSVKH